MVPVAAHVAALDLGCVWSPFTSVSSPPRSCNAYNTDLVQEIAVLYLHPPRHPSGSHPTQFTWLIWSFVDLPLNPIHRNSGAKDGRMHHVTCWAMSTSCGYDVPQRARRRKGVREAGRPGATVCRAQGRGGSNQAQTLGITHPPEPNV